MKNILKYHTKSVVIFFLASFIVFIVFVSTVIDIYSGRHLEGMFFAIYGFFYDIVILIPLVKLMKTNAYSLRLWAIFTAISVNFSVYLGFKDGAMIGTCLLSFSLLFFFFYTYFRSEKQSA